MATIRSYTNAYELSDLVQAINTVPNIWDLTANLNLFTSQGVTGPSVTLEQIDKNFGIIPDRIRGERASVGKDYARLLRSFAIPHFPHDEYITPQDVEGQVGWNTRGANDQYETLAAVRMRKLERARMNHAITLEAARISTIVTGASFAPNNTVKYDWYTEFNKTREVIDFKLDDPTSNVITTLETVWSSMQDKGLSGTVFGGQIIAIASPEFFAALVNHPQLIEAYRSYQINRNLAPNLLVDRLTNTMGLDNRYRDFVWGNIRFVEYRGLGFDGNRIVPAGDVYFLPRGVEDAFVTYFAPCSKFGYLNTVGQEVYAFEYPDEKDEKITIETETNFINVLRRPQLVIRGTI